MNKDELLEIAENTLGEGAQKEFKSMIDWSLDGEVIELIKDIIAMANSGGGCILLGINDDGTINNGYNYVDIDNSTLINKIRKYTNIEFDNYEINTIQRLEKGIHCIFVFSSHRLIVFEKPGTYPNPKEIARQKTAFSQGTIYVRHGAKSETCNNIDIIESYDRELDRIKESWLKNIKTVVEAPIGHVIQMIPPNVIMKESEEATAIRITDDENAPIFKLENPDTICPFRQKDILNHLNEKLNPSLKINQYDIQAIIHVYDIDKTKPNFFYKSLYGPKQYSQSFIDWIIKQYQMNSSFFIYTREKYKDYL